MLNWKSHGTYFTYAMLVRWCHEAYVTQALNSSALIHSNPVHSAAPVQASTGLAQATLLLDPCKLRHAYLASCFNASLVFNQGFHATLKVFECLPIFPNLMQTYSGTQLVAPL